MVCKKIFIETDLIVPRGLCHGNYSKQGSETNCAEINVSEEKFFIQMKEHLTIYQFKKCKVNKRDNPKIMKFICEVVEKIKKINELYEKIVAFDEDKVKNDVQEALNIQDEDNKITDEIIP